MENLTITVLVEGILERMERDGLNKHMLSDFSCTVPLSLEDLYNAEITEKKLNLILMEIEKYLELKPIPLRIEYATEKEDTGGYYRHNGSERYIMVFNLYHFEPDQMIAILCYLCTHYFMEIHNLGWSDSGMNQKRANVMAILLGFGNCLVAGYQGRQIQKTQDNDVITTRYKLRYFNIAECRQVMEQRKRWQKEQKRKEEEQIHKEQLERMRCELEINLYRARATYMVIKCIDLTKIENEAVYENLGFRAALLEYERTDPETVLEMCERWLYATPDELHIRKAMNKLSELTLKLDRLLQAFRYFSLL